GKQMFPQSYAIAANLGSALVAANRTTEGVPELERALSLQPSSTMVLNNLGVCYAKKHDYGRALDYWNRSLSIEPRQLQIRPAATPARLDLRLSLSLVLALHARRRTRSQPLPELPRDPGPSPHPRAHRPRPRDLLHALPLRGRRAAPQDEAEVGQDLPRHHLSHPRAPREVRHGPPRPPRRGPLPLRARQ